MTVIGWGKTKDPQKPIPTTLREVSVPVITNQSCWNTYPKLENDLSMFCAGLEQGGKDACTGKIY